jgi:hypothetical protein
MESSRAAKNLMDSNATRPPGSRSPEKAKGLNPEAWN